MDVGSPQHWLQNPTHGLKDVELYTLLNSALDAPPLSVGTKWRGGRVSPRGL